MSYQEEFDRTYITSSEVCRIVGVTRSAIIQARNKGTLPEPILIDGHLALWKRAIVEPYVMAWRQRRLARIGVA